jgi:hypothetical protein
MSVLKNSPLPQHVWKHAQRAHLRIVTNNIKCSTELAVNTLHLSRGTGSASGPDQAQRLLDRLSIFCAIFKMEVNQHETKTCAVVFRCQNSRIPADIVLACSQRRSPR